jgi:pre-mRNA-processing factor 19
MLETYQLKAQLTETRKNLAKALYENDAAFRVIARLIKERDEAKRLLNELRADPAAASKLAPAVPAPMETEEEDQGLTPAIVSNIGAAHKALSKGRRKRIKAKATKAASKEALRRYSAKSSLSLHSPSTPGITCLDLHPTQSHLFVTGGKDGNVITFDSQAGKVTNTLKSHKKRITSVVYHPNNLLISTSADSTAIVWAQAEAGYAARYTAKCHTGEVVGSSLHPSNDYFVTASTDKSWAFHDLATGVMRKRVTDSDVAYTNIAFHPDGMLLGVCTADSTVSMVDVQSFTGRARLKGHSGKLTALAFSQNGYYLASGDDQGVVNLWDLRKVRNFHTINSADISTVSHLSFDPSGSYLSVAGTDIRLFDTKAWDLVNSYKDHRNTVTGVCFTDNVDSFASCSLDRTVKLWSASE